MMERGNQNLESVCVTFVLSLENMFVTQIHGQVFFLVPFVPILDHLLVLLHHHITLTHTQVRVSMNITQVQFKRFREFCLTGKMFASYVLRFYSWNLVYNIFCTVFLSCHRLQNYYRRIRVPSLLFFHLWCNFNILSFFWQQYILLCVNLTLTLSLLLLEHHSLFLSARKYI